jgi:hypothetical protein
VNKITSRRPNLSQALINSSLVNMGKTDVKTDRGSGINGQIPYTMRHLKGRNGTRGSEGP